MKPIPLALLICAMMAAPAWAASGTMIKNDALRQSASSSAASVGQVNKGASVEILARQGGWTQIRHAGATGWVRILSVKTSSGSTGGDALGLIEMGTSRNDPSRVVAVAGLRGLKEEEPRSLNEEALRTARFNANEVLRLDQYISSRSDAEQFARSSGLRRLEVAYIALPKRKQESTPSNSPWGESGL
jgi:hypothetical protein